MCAQGRRKIDPFWCFRRQFCCFWSVPCLCVMVCLFLRWEASAIVLMHFLIEFVEKRTFRRTSGAWCEQAENWSLFATESSLKEHDMHMTAELVSRGIRCSELLGICESLSDVQHEKMKCTRGLSCAQGIVVYAPENMGIVCVWSVVRNNLVWTRHKKTPRGNFMVVRSEWPLWFLNRGYSMTSSSRIIAMDSRLWFYHEVSTPKLSYFQEFGRLSCVLFFVSH